ncbi:MAG: methionine--tRNA ligase [Candidatus Obscuribacter sp.]|nr:methionine--tRNA ligase [Candidatus Obscuribacter sp.]
MKKFYVTTAIDYVNAAPHIGHAYEKIAADVVARYYRLRGFDVFFLTGVDEHGSKVEKSAQAAGKTPIQFCDEISSTFEKSWRNLNLSFDYFIRTTEERHAKVVQSLFTKLKEQGDIYKSTYMGLYCEGCEDFLRERDLDDNGHCPTHKKAPRELAEENYFFKLSKYKPAIKQWLEENPDAVRPEGRRKEVLNQLNDPELTDFSVSRSRKSLSWGIPIPDDDDQVIYVWMDALTNYITGVGYLSDEKQFERYWPADLHLIGKDITKFHSIYWIAFLLAASLPLPKQIYAHGFITVEGQKISKSLGNVIDPNKLVEEFGADAVRFFLMSGTSFDQDGDFSKHEFIRKVNSELANNLGNLVNRTLTLIDKNLDGKIPDCKPEHDLREKANTLHTVFDTCMERLEFAKAIEAVMATVDQTNKYMNDEKPWTQFKEGKVKEGSEVLYTAVEMLRRVAFQIYPFAPKMASDIWWQLGHDDTLEVIGDSEKPDGFFDMIPVGQKVRNTGPIFKRLEEPVAS